jgi:hypothetical protein
MKRYADEVQPPRSHWYQDFLFSTTAGYPGRKQQNKMQQSRATLKLRDPYAHFAIAVQALFMNPRDNYGFNEECINDERSVQYL